ncbi:hypothetical protein ACVPOY_12290 [Staphylococcus aureus]
MKQSKQKQANEQQKAQNLFARWRRLRIRTVNPQNGTNK